MATWSTGAYTRLQGVFTWVDLRPFSLLFPKITDMWNYATLTQHTCPRQFHYQECCKQGSTWKTIKLKGSSLKFIDFILPPLFNVYFSFVHTHNLNTYTYSSFKKLKYWAEQKYYCLPKGKYEELLLCSHVYTLTAQKHIVAMWNA